MGDRGERVQQGGGEGAQQGVLGAREGQKGGMCPPIGTRGCKGCVSSWSRPSYPSSSEGGKASPNQGSYGSETRFGSRERA